MGWVDSSLLLLLLLLFFAAHGHEGAFVGVNIGTEVANMSSTSKVVALLKKQQITHIRLFDVDRQMLIALANTGIQVIVGVPNGHLLGVGESRSAAANRVNKNVAAYVPDTNITSITMGSEVLTIIPNAALVLVPP